ncbi:MAG: Gfo/Idh/MocA family oxidoreductase [Pseudomonadota bacterium]
MERRDTAQIRLGMVGGGRDAFIGGVHRIASRIDDRFELVAGCFSSTAEKSKASGADLGLDPARVYGDFSEMAASEAARDDGIEAVAIVTPNHMHLPPAREFLSRNIHVICDKPLSATLDEARDLVALVEENDAVFVLTHNYSGYPMMRQAREMVAKDELGTIRVVQAEYPQGWLATALEESEHKQASWRTDPARSGAGGCIGDIGTHAFHIASFVTGLSVDQLSADLQSFVSGRRLDDNAQVLLRYEGGARGMIWASQVAVGCENGLKLRVYGTKAGIEWAQEDPNYLWYSPLTGPKQLLTRAGAGATDAGNSVVRIPAGHPEGYLEGFATIYADAADAIRAHQAGLPRPDHVLCPTIDDGLTGVAFVDACVRSSAQDAAWVRLDK